MIFSNLHECKAYKNSKYIKLTIYSSDAKIISESEVDSLECMNALSQATVVEIDYIKKEKKKKDKWLK